ncbi:MAG: CDP-alcohol phosphatidyltransferase family protein [Acutalibacteraceae bacterium]|nr:CDP-alcohol phosphatidyltransferase family protein [Acutalibacteraceae bacterium]
MNMVKRYLKDWNTIPNLISYVRILLVPVFAILFRQGYLGWALVAIVVSGLTDFVDGKIARKFNQVSDLGKLLDPLADKITQITLAILLFLEFNECSDNLMKTFSWVFLVFLVKEAIFVIGGVIMLSLGMVPSAAEIYGKVSTFFFYGVMVVLFLFGPEVGVFSRNFTLPSVACVVLIVISVILTLVAFVSYLPDVFRQCKEKFAKK